MTDTTPTPTDRNRTDADPRAEGPDRLSAGPERDDADLTAVVVEYDLGPDECTVYPRKADDQTLMTEWITAEEGSYVALDEMR
ncbi:hypothetical protein NGM10_10910 [Halorussus salilacus]|uniref:DUF7511 domain-containing protein n=1 Tax=Halorussus salilacus TaxID=2953750 RepID=UPI00209F88A9|nr:hypothetical protein [Halorussus salilacus]USZ67239.1 hypothetical protein NGM10_10910 [Halorussus salilacus]